MDMRKSATSQEKGNALFDDSGATLPPSHHIYVHRRPSRPFTSVTSNTVHPTHRCSPVECVDILLLLRAVLVDDVLDR
eukprot:1757793-Rhodomonas_salina.1